MWMLSWKASLGLYWAVTPKMASPNIGKLFDPGSQCGVTVVLENCLSPASRDNVAPRY